MGWFCADAAAGGGQTEQGALGIACRVRREEAWCAVTLAAGGSLLVCCHAVCTELTLGDVAWDSLVLWTWVPFLK